MARTLEMPLEKMGRLGLEWKNEIAISSMLSGLKDGGVFLLNSPWTAAEMDSHLPASMKKQLAKKHIRFWNIDAIDLALKVGMGNRINTIMQAAFFKLAEVIPYEKADEYMTNGSRR